MELRILQPGEPLPLSLSDVELRGPDNMPRVWHEPGSNPPNLQKVAPKIANLSHAYLHNLHDVDCIWSHPVNTPPEVRAGTLWDDVYSDRHGWFTPGDTVRPSGLHGHPLYAQTDETFGTRTFRRCVFGRGFAGTVGKAYAESPGVNGGSKTANYVFEDCIFFGGWFLVGNFGANNRGAVNITVRNCVFIGGDVQVGYNDTVRDNILIEGNTIFGNLIMNRGANVTIRNNQVIVSPPYRQPGFTYGAGNYGVGFGMETVYTDLVMEGNAVYTDQPNAAFNGWGRQEAINRGVAVRDTQVYPRAQFPAFTRRIDIPERNAAWIAVYNPSGAETVPLDGYYRVRDVRRWHSPYVSNALVMAGEPDAPVNWPAEQGPPPITPNLLPTFLIARLETVPQEEIIVTIEERLIAVETELASIRTAYLAEVAVKDAQIVTLTTERDAALASASVFRGVLGSVNALVAGYPPVP